MKHGDAAGNDLEQKRPFPWAILGVILVAYALYIYQLDGASLWRDEALSFARTQQPVTTILTNRNIVDGVIAPDLHPPLYFLMLSGWRLLVGDSEFALRYLSALFMILATSLFYAVGKRIWGRRSGELAAGMAVFSSFFWWYAQEARMYALVVVESLLLFYTLWPLLLGQARWKQYLSFALTAVALSFTHYSGLFLVAFAIFAWVFVQFQERFRWQRLTALILIGGAALWFLYPHVSELVAAPTFFTFSQRPLWAMTLEAINTFSLGSAGPMENPGWRLLPFIILGLAGAFTSNRRSALRHWQATLIGVGGFVIPLLLFFIASWLQANYSNPRHLTILSIPWYLLMGHGLAMVWRRWRTIAVVVGLGALTASVPALTQTINNPTIVKDDVRGLARYIEARAQPGDAIIWHNAVMMVTYKYYALDLPYESIPSYGSQNVEKTLERLETRANLSQRIWFVDSPGPYYFDKNIVRDWLDTNMVRADSADFPASWESLLVRLYHWPQTSLPTDTSLQADLQEGAYHILAAASENTAIAGEGMWWSVLWAATETAVPPPSACLHLRDSANVIWASGCAPLIMPQNQEADTKNPLTQQLWLALPDGLAPIPYTIELALDNAVQKIGVITVMAANTSAAEPIVQYENGLSLVGLEWDNEQFRAGLWAVGNLVWQTDALLEPGLRTTIRFVDWLGRSAAEQKAALGPVDYPAEQWRVGDSVRSFVGIRLPVDANGRYRVQIQLTDQNGNPLSRSWKTIGRVQIEPWLTTRQLPDVVPYRPENIFWGENISLAGYDAIREEDEVTVKLYWKAEGEIDRDYGVFVHIGQAGMPPVAQSSAEPASWMRPTTSWRAGEIVEDVHVIQIPPGVNIEENIIFVGLYEIDSPEVRIPVTAVGEPVPNNAWPLALPDSKLGDED